jgi:hypothetical protein
MSKQKLNIKNSFIQLLEKRFLEEMPRIRKEIKVYETHLKKGLLNNSQKTAPQFNS